MSTLVIADHHGTIIRRISLHGLDRLTLGRSTQRDLIINHPGISRFHSVLYHEDGHWCIADAGSRGGTRVDGKAVLWKRLSPERTATVGAFALWIDTQEDSGLSGESAERMNHATHRAFDLCAATAEQSAAEDVCGRTSSFLNAETDFLPLADSDPADPTPHDRPITAQMVA